MVTDRAQISKVQKSKTLPINEVKQNKYFFTFVNPFEFTDCVNHGLLKNKTGHVTLKRKSYQADAIKYFKNYYFFLT